MEGTAENSRAVMIASGWIEWTGEKGNKQPWHFHRWSAAQLCGAVGEQQAARHHELQHYHDRASDSCGIYHDRMPALLDRDEMDAWLAAPDLDLIRSYRGEIVATPANRALNKSATTRGAELLIAGGPVEFPRGGFHD